MNIIGLAPSFGGGTFRPTCALVKAEKNNRRINTDDNFRFITGYLKIDIFIHSIPEL